MMCQRSLPIDRSILVAFKDAQEAGRLDVAEHLLCALECLCGGAAEGNAAEDAYRMICRNSGARSGKREEAWAALPPENSRRQ